MCICDTIATGQCYCHCNSSLPVILLFSQVSGLMTGLSQITRVSLGIHSFSNGTTLTLQIPPHWRSPIGRFSLNLSSCEMAAALNFVAAVLTLMVTTCRATCALSVQLFYASRLWIMSMKNNWILPVVIACLSILGWCMEIMSLFI